MKSRFFSIPGLLVDVTEIVSITYPTENDNTDCRIGFRHSSSVYTDPGTAKAIQEYVEEYEQSWFDPPPPPADPASYFISNNTIGGPLNGILSGLKGEPE